METARAPGKQSASPTAAATARRTGVERTAVPGAQAAMRQVAGPSVRLGTETTPPAPALPEHTAKTVAGTGPGQPLPQDIRQTLEKNFGASLEKVRVHTDSAATRAAQGLSARAFTYGNHIFLGPGEKPTDLGLIAHEAAHVVQQRGAPVVQRFGSGQSNAHEAEAQRASAAALRQEPFNVRERTGGFSVQRLGKSDALDFFADAANAIPGFRMFTIIIGVNPINMSHVEASPANILRAIIEFVPGGGLITEALDKYGIFDKVGNFVAEQLHSLGMTGSVIKQAINEFLDSLSWSDIFDLDGVWERAKRIFTEPIDRIKSFVEGLASGIIKLIKDAVLMPLAALAAETRGWDLLIAILGKNPITDEPVPQDAETLIGGFLKLIGQDAVFQTMKEARAVPRAIAWFQSNLGTLLGFVQQIPSLAINAFNALELEDLILLPRAIKKVAAVFGNFIGDFTSWVGKALWDLLELIFDVVSPGALGYIKKTGAALKSILKNPLPFVGNLVKAAKLGFQSFASNIGQHFKAGLLDWLTGSLPGVYIPKSFDLGEIVKLVFSVLGLTWANIRAKLVKVIGEDVMKALEVGFDIVVTLVTQGPAAAWEKIKDQLITLKDQVIGGIVDMVVDMVKKKAIPKIVAMFIPGAGFISAIISIYDTVMVFVEKLSKIAKVVTSFVNSIVSIAAGDISGAARRVESTLAGLLSLAISFLAGFAGFGKVADKVMGIIQKVRATVDKAIDWLINWIVTTAKRLFAALFGKKDKDKDKDNAEGSAQKTFSLPKEGHTVTATAKDGKLKVSIQSDLEGDILAMIATAKSEVTADEGRDDTEKSKILGDLQGAREMVLSMGTDWSTARNQKLDYKSWAEIRLAQIVNLLGHLGADGIKAFRDFKAQVPDKRYLPSSFQVREKLYMRGSGWSSNQAAVAKSGEAEVRSDVDDVINFRVTDPTKADAAWNRLVKGLRKPYGSTKANLTLQHLASTPYDVDHKDVLSIHWTSGGGNNTGDSDRWKLSNTANLRYITKKDNLARQDVNYLRYVGKGFSSVYAQGGAPTARKIDGQPFLDANGAPI
jgi:hypothetical protein